MTGHGIIFFKLFITFINRLIAWKKKCNHLYFDAVTILRKLSHTFFCEPGERRGGGGLQAPILCIQNNRKF